MATPPALDPGLPPFALLLRRHRSRVGLTQRELADLSTVSVRAIRDLEQGRALRPRPDTVRLIAEGLRLGSRARHDLEVAADPDRRAEVDSAAAVPPTSLAAQVGRDVETGALAAELAGGCRLATVVGLPGVGKTRFAAAVAEVLHARMPVLWAGADSTPLRDARLAGLVTAWSTAVRTGGRVDDDLAEVIGARSALVVLDGVDGPVRGDGVLRLLADCPGVRVLITAPAPCGLAGERVFLLSGLEPADAARLLLAEQHGPVDAVEVDRLCQALDGVPAALAAVGSWLSVYPLSELAATDPACLLDDVLVRALAGAAAPYRRFLEDLPPRFGPSADTGRLLRDLLQRGLVRPVETGTGRSFTVSPLIRSVLAATP
ncbi:helix-turn-helix domain-containing protein [Lentzea sp. HUAS12]|uniref:helix-turn-helix domain-containing protein n=1 Tax=Lentzea sp. HUAS12 TaxID=2951806 RepID=UPI00209CC052|nr:helix-turn-helix domain-containing protein [Lentzea sp. HUAS12]USX53645.1 helix-turn-helix domain-containing protein [Lentzea sp. HUAS12]